MKGQPMLLTAVHWKAEWLASNQCISVQNWQQTFERKQECMQCRNLQHPCASLSSSLFALKPPAAHSSVSCRSSCHLQLWPPT